MNTQRKLFERYLRNECTTDELRSLISRFSAEEDEFILKQIILEKLKEAQGNDQVSSMDLDIKERDLHLLLSANIKKSNSVKLWTTIGVAASILLIFSFGSYFLFHQSHFFTPINSINVDYKAVNMATLTLSDGRKIDIEKSRMGQIANQGSVNIVKTKNGLTYIVKAGHQNFSDKNTLSTGKGQQYALELADGTKVWLNARSSIRFPVTFSKSARNVELIGEAYFQVAHDHLKPFYVNSGTQVVEVLGTDFVINSYDDEPKIKTTLIEGRVKVYNKNKKKYRLLIPGQEASYDGESISVANADTLAAIAWKNNLFQFRNADLKSVMREFSRWYDIDVVYEGDILVTDEFTGKIPRDESLATVIKLLKAYGINVRLEDKKLVVRGK